MPSESIIMRDFSNKPGDACTRLTQTEVIHDNLGMLSRCLHTQTEEDSPERFQPSHVISGVNTWTSFSASGRDQGLPVLLCRGTGHTVYGARRQLHNFFA